MGIELKIAILDPSTWIHEEIYLGNNFNLSLNFLSAQNARISVSVLQAGNSPNEKVGNFMIHVIIFMADNLRKLP